MPPPSNAYGLVVDDHPLVAHGITEFLRAHPLLSEALLAVDAESALALMAERGAPAIVLLDFWLGGDTARLLVQTIQSHYLATRILAVSGDARPGVVDAMRAAGAHGFVSKHEPPDCFQRAITALLHGQSWFAAEGGMPVGGSPFDDLPVTPAELGLTERQGEILALLLTGQPNKRIAQETGLSEATVKEHVSSVLHRLGVRSRFEVVTKLRGRRLGLRGDS